MSDGLLSISDMDAASPTNALYGRLRWSHTSHPTECFARARCEWTHYWLGANRCSLRCRYHLKFDDSDTPDASFQSYVPYAAFPMNVQGLDQSQTLPISKQAPVVPTGFIHGDQGTLIAVYNQDALEQYMSSARSGVSSSQPRNGATWQQPTPPPPLSFVAQSALPASSSSQAFTGTGMGWVNGPLPQGPPLPPCHPVNAVPDPPMAYHQLTGVRGSSCDSAGGQPSSVLLRRNQRRDQQDIHNGGRTDHSRAASNRYPRTNGGNADQTVHAVQINSPHLTPLLSDWNQWTTDH